MSIFNEIRDKAEKLLNQAEPFVTRKTHSYDAYKNKVFVAGIDIDGAVNTVISADTITKQDVGIDYYYTTYYQSVEPRTLTLHLLPTARCLPLLRDLAWKQQKTRGWFNISIFENGTLVNIYRAWVIAMPEIDMQQEAGDRQVVFGIKTHIPSTTKIGQFTDFEQDAYSKFGARPDEASAKANSTIDVQSGDVVPEDDDFFTYPDGFMIDGTTEFVDAPQLDIEYEAPPSVPDVPDNDGGYIEGEGFEKP